MRFFEGFGLAVLLAAAPLLAGAQGRPVVPPGPQVPQAQKPPFPLLELPDRESRGQRAVDLLGNRLPDVAAWYRKSPDEFRAMLLNDLRMRLDAKGRVFVVDDLEGPLPEQADASTSSVLDGTLAPLDQTFLLHSRPGAQRTIYLNFKGATLTGTGWNASGSATIIAQPFDMDGIASTFATSELERIQTIWQRVAEDFAPFDVNVTTEAPPADALERSSSTDPTFGTTVLITNSAGVYTCSCGGVAYLGSFDDTSSYYKPALVFYDKLSRSEKNIAEAASHEAGHNLGLSHDGTSTLGYYRGHGTGATGWAPIMGVGYDRPLVQWSKGEYLDANNRQDDFAVAQSNGLPLRADDHGNTAAGATPLTGADNGGVTNASVTGVIERSTDVDAFAFSAAAGPLTLALRPASRAANLDAVLELRDAAGSVLATSNPVDALDADISITLPAAGTYTVTVRGTGKGDPLTTGYSSYGSLGNYALSASFYTPGGTAPVAVMSATPTSGTAPLTVAFSGASSSDADGSIVGWEWTFGDGTTAIGVNASHTYTAAGTYTAQLRVTDDDGLSSTTSVTVNVGAVAVPISVTTIDMSRTVSRNRTRADAVVTIVNANGQPVSGVTVSGNWSGVVSGAVSGVTGADGRVSFASAQTRSTTGSFVFTVTGATRAGHAYTPGSNLETSDSITVR